MPLRAALLSGGMYMGVSIDQMTNGGYFPTQKDHLPLLEGVPKHIYSNKTPNLCAPQHLCATPCLLIVEVGNDICDASP